MFTIPLATHVAYAILALRLALGATFIAHGLMKLKKMWRLTPSAQMPSGMLGLMRFLSIVEPLGGLGVLFGVLTQWAAAGLALIMLGAIYFKITKWHAPFASTEKMGWEFDLLLLAMCIALVIMGAGRLALVG